MNPIKRLIARNLMPGRFPAPSTPTPHGDRQRRRGSPDVEPTPHRPARRLGQRFRHWRALALVVGLIAGATAHAALSAKPNPSSNGAYTVSWTSVSGASRYRLLEGSKIVFEGLGLSKAFSGKAAGSYAYTLMYCQNLGFPVGTICLPSGFDALTVTVSGTPPPPPPTKPALTVPASSSTGSYTVSWTKPSKATRFELQEKAGSGAWSGAYSGAATSKSFSGKGTGTHSYRVRACAGQTNCSGWSATGSIRVTVISATLQIKPNPAPGGNYTVRWTGTGSELLESFNNGATTKTYAVSGTSKAFAGKPPGSYAYTLRLCFNLFGTNTCVPASQVATVTVPAPAPTGTISAKPSPCTIPAGATRCSTTVTWSTQNATSPCVYVKSSMTKFACSKSGSKVAPWIIKGGRTLELKNGGDYATAKTLATVFVKGVPAATPAPTVTASFNLSEVKKGNNVTLTWTSSNATSCSGSPSIGSTDPSGTKAYTTAAVGEFSVKVTCTGAGGNGSATAKVDVVDAPGTPSAPTVTASGSTKLSVSWTAPGDNGATITGYAVRYRMNSNMAGWGKPVSAGTSTSKMLSGLAANTAYQVQVRARNRVGAGGWSAPADGRTGAVPITPPATPTSFTVPASDADGNFRISWEASAGATRYEVQERFSTGAWRDLEAVTDTGVDLSGKHITPPNTAHEYRVRACATAASSSCSGWTTQRKVTVSGALTAEPNPSADGAYEVRWTPALATTLYKLEESTDGGSTWPTTFTLFATETHKSFSGKTPGTYTYRILSCVVIGLVPSATCQVLVPTKLQVKVHEPLAAPTLSVAPDPAPGGTYQVSWTASPEATNHVLQERTNGGDWSNVTGVTGQSRSFSNPGAAVYGYQVKACDEDGDCGPWSAVATVRVPPAAPTLSGACMNGGYELSWTTVTDATNTVVEQRKGTGKWTQAYRGTGSKTARMLTTDASYSFRAKACAANANCSGWGATLAVTAPDCSGPDVPGNLRPDATGPDDYSIRWDAVSGNNISYELEQRFKSGDWTGAHDGTALSKSFSDQPNGAYRYRVRARSATNARSGYTGELSVTVPIPPPVPANLKATAPNADRAFTVSWDAVSWGGASATYRLEETHGAQTDETPVSGTSKSFTGKAPGTYGYRVKACAPASNCGRFGAAQSVTVPPDAPATPSLVCDGSSHKLSWPKVSGATGYLLKKKREDQSNWEPNVSVQDNSTTLTLTVGTDYNFEIKACAGDSNCGAWSPTATTTAPDCTKPGVPAGLAITPTGPDSYKVSWNPVSGTQRTYQLQERVGAGSWQDAHNGASTEKPFTGKPNGTYAYQVRACPQAGECSAYSTPLSVTVPIPPSVPSGLAATTPDSDGDYTVSWHTVTWGGAVTYTLEEQPVGGTWAEVHNAAATSRAIAGKANGSYAYRVRACAGGACSGWNDSLTVSVSTSAAAKVETPPAPHVAKPSLVSAAEMKATDATGTVAGAFRVTESGAASYRIPIYATPGTAGVAPELALAYNSQAGNGIAGLGWTLEGGSAITRCRATRHQDGAAKPIQWNAEDKFCLDGQRLVLDSGAYGSPGSTYRTEIDTFAVIKAVGGTAGHPDHFEVRRKDGSVSHYGNVPGSAFKDAKRRNGKGQTLTWALKRFTDSVGNPVWHLYGGGADSHRLAEVRYAYGSERRIDGHHAAIKLIYADRSDDVTGYVAGHAFASRKRLTAAQTLNHDGTALKVVRELRLSYRNTARAADKTSRLVSITGCVSEDAAATCKPATTFTWPANAVGFKAAASGSAKLTPRKDRGVLSHHPADVNGDGMMDLVWVEWDVDGANDTDHHLKYALSDGSMLKPALFGNGAASIEHKDNVSRAGPAVLARPIDYNGDGRMDVALWRSRDPVWRIHLSAPTIGGGWRLDAAAVETPVTDRLAEFTDLNGDGLADAVYGRGATIRARHLERDPAQPDASSKPYKFGAEATLATVSGGAFGALATTVNTSLQAGSHDFNGDGRADFIASTYFEGQQSGPRLAPSRTVSGPYIQGPNGWALYANFRGETLHAADFNGDGLTDLVREARIGGQMFPYLEVNTGAGFTSHFSALPLKAEDVRILPPADHNGDGHPDLIWHDRRTERINVLPFDPNTGKLAGLNDAALAVSRAGKKHAHLFLDADGDGAADYLKLSDASGKGKLETFASKNAGRFPRQVSSITNGLGAVTSVTHASLARTDHYERLDVQRTVVPTQFCHSFLGGSGCLPYGNPIDRELETVDQDGNPLTQAEIAANARALLDKRTKAFYAELNAGWSLPAGAQTLGRAGPVLEFRAPVPVVVRVEGTAPAAGSSPGAVAAGARSAVEHFYADAKVQAMGRGPLGFGQLKTRDAQTGVQTTTRYRHDFPFTGMPAATEVRTASGRLLSSSTTTWRLTGYQTSWQATSQASGTAALGALQPHAARTVERSYDLNGGTHAKPTPLATVTTDLEQDAHGNAAKVSVTAEGGGRTFGTVTENAYGTTASDRRLGRLTGTAVTHTRRKSSEPADQAAKAVRRSAFAYYGQSACPASNSAHAGLLCREVVEPDRERLKVTTTHSYDAFGNRVRSKVNYFDDVPLPGRAAPTGTARIRTRCDADAVAHDARGRFVKARFDCQGRRLSEVRARGPHGSPTEVRRFLDKAGAKHVTDTAARTPGGAEVLSASATGAHAIATRAMGAPKGDGAASCPAGTAYHERVRRGGGGESVACLDALARAVRTATRGFDGKWVHVDTEYDALGRVRRASEPHYAGETQCSKAQGDSRCWTTADHDILGRIAKVTGPDGSGTAFAHEGFATTTTNALGQKAKETRNALGETVLTEDHHGGEVEFSRDAQGNVVRTTRRKPAADASPAPASVATAAAFDLLGRMTAQDDPDLGRTEYRYNSLGELRCRRDAVGNLTATAYDGLGRMASRKDYRAHGGVACATLAQAQPSALEGDASWTHDAGTGLGQLTSEADAVSGYRRSQAHDALGRPSAAATVPGTGAGAHHEKATYDGFGRPFQFFDASRTEARFDFNGVRHAYNAHGHFKRLQDAEGTFDAQGTFAPKAVYRRVTAMDARGNVTAETLGNGVRRTHAFDGRTGRLLGIKAGRSSASDLQDLSYQWDALGNLKSRASGRGAAALVEAFGYDGLNRLTSLRVGSRPAMAASYDGYGNIRSRTGVGTYAYGADAGASGRPHAVASVTKAGSTVTHAYDANGSLTSSSDGRTITYAAFGKATSIARGGRSSAFAHGPDRSRFRRTDTDPGGTTTTLYLGGVEKVTHPDGAETVRRRIGGTAIEIEGPARGGCEADAVRHVLRDHLGSVDRLTDAQGAESQAMSFGAWGDRRDPADWTGLAEATAASFDTCATTRGFTGHETLDAVGAVHMNGRLHDPALGRFLRADPFVQFPASLQGHNRYSYALNNPLAHTDPSGYFVFSLAATAYLAGAKAGLTTIVATVAAAGLGDALAQGASFGQALRAGFISGVSAAAFSGIGSGLGARFDGGFAAGLSPAGFGLKVLAHGAVGGITSVLGGGRFGHGFASGGLTALGSGLNNSRFIGGLGFSPLRVAVGAAIGGTASRITGGKFANGAVTGAFSQALNNERSEARAAAEKANRSNFQSALNALRRDGTLDPSRDFDTADDAAKEVLNATAPLSAEYGLEVAGSIYETPGRQFRYTFPEMGEATHAGLTTKYRGYHTHPGGDLKFSNSFRNVQNTEGNDYNWVRTARKDLYMGLVNDKGAVRIGVCEYLKCFGHGQYGTDPSRIVQ